MHWLSALLGTLLSPAIFSAWKLANHFRRLNELTFNLVGEAGLKKGRAGDLFHVIGNKNSLIYCEGCLLVSFNPAIHTHTHTHTHTQGPSATPPSTAQDAARTKSAAAAVPA